MERAGVPNCAARAGCRSWPRLTDGGELAAQRLLGLHVLCVRVAGVRLIDEPVVGRRDAFAQLDRMPPAEIVEAADIEQLARGSVRFGRIEHEHRRWMDDAPNELGELANRQVVARADVD